MKELMLELLAWEPFGKFLLKEKEYIREILSGNDNPPSSLAKFHEFFQASMTTMFSVRSSRMLRRPRMLRSSRMLRRPRMLSFPGI